MQRPQRNRPFSQADGKDDGGAAHDKDAVQRCRSSLLGKARVEEGFDVKEEMGVMELMTRDEIGGGG